MKTFEEAFKSINRENLSANLHETMGDNFQSEEFKKMIENLALALWRAFATCDDEKQAMAFTCAAIQSYISTGILIGIEMEKR